MKFIKVSERIEMEQFMFSIRSDKEFPKYYRFDRFVSFPFFLIFLKKEKIVTFLFFCNKSKFLQAYYFRNSK